MAKGKQPQRKLDIEIRPKRKIDWLLFDIQEGHRTVDDIPPERKDLADEYLPSQLNAIKKMSPALYRERRKAINDKMMFEQIEAQYPDTDVFGEVMIENLKMKSGARTVLKAIIREEQQCQIKLRYQQKKRPLSRVQRRRLKNSMATSLKTMQNFATPAST